MEKPAQTTLSLHNGVLMPRLGLGVYKVNEGDEAYRAVTWAIECGYRHFDTAALYGNEVSVGRALRDAMNRGQVKREDLFVTTKVWNSDQGYDNTLRAFDRSAKKIGLDTIDLYLIHWPVASAYKDTYRALEKLYKEGRARAIGVSNFMIPHLEDLLGSCTVQPMVNQYEFHPYLQQPELSEYCRRRDIVVTAWSPLMVGKVLNDPAILRLARQYARSPAQIVLRWQIQKDLVTIPKSVRKERIAENHAIFDFALAPEDMLSMDRLDRHERHGSDPMNFNF